MKVLNLDDLNNITTMLLEVLKGETLEYGNKIIIAKGLLEGNHGIFFKKII